MKLPAALEAILFAAESPIPERELAEALQAPAAEVRAELLAMAARLEDPERGLTLENVAGGWRLYGKAEARPYLERFASSPSASRLSNAALETLAVVAYRQPVSRGQIAELRGVDSESSLRTLARRGLVEEAGRISAPGNPAVYRTTDLFLEMTGMRSLDELPPLADHVPPAETVESLERGTL